MAAYGEYWLREVVRPNLQPKTYEAYESALRLYIRPSLRSQRLDRLTVPDVRSWLNRFRTTCQCCAHERDVPRPPEQRRCCAVGNCCEAFPSADVVPVARNVLRAMLSNAVAEELVIRNVAALVKAPPPPKRHAWSVEEARRFLESARHEDDPLYAAYVLLLVLGLRRGELLAWPGPT